MIWDYVVIFLAFLGVLQLAIIGKTTGDLLAKEKESPPAKKARAK